MSVYMSMRTRGRHWYENFDVVGIGCRMSVCLSVCLSVDVHARPSLYVNFDVIGIGCRMSVCLSVCLSVCRCARAAVTVCKF